MSSTPQTDKEVKLVGMLGEQLVGVGLCRRLELRVTALEETLARLRDTTSCTQAQYAIIDEVMSDEQERSVADFGTLQSDIGLP